MQKVCEVMVPTVEGEWERQAAFPAGTKRSAVESYFNDKHLVLERLYQKEAKRVPEMDVEVGETLPKDDSVVWATVKHGKSSYLRV